jgi:hypothetical protein
MLATMPRNGIEIVDAGRGEKDCRKYCETAGAAIRRGECDEPIAKQKEGRPLRGPQSSFVLVTIPAVVMVVVVTRIVGVITMMVAVMVMMVVAMMIAVPSCGWDRAAGRECANNT